MGRVGLAHIFHILDIDLLVVVHPSPLPLLRHAMLTQLLELSVKSCLMGCGCGAVVQGQLSSCCGSLQGVGREREGIALWEMGRGTQDT